ncbi:hypothetical protein [Neisseria weaveri]|uniref:Membrane lipoprotein n=1 Tax=Neisseria weaveri TaxID=28091 RepID=A0A3S5F9I1_9NEIS|nr:hypothetical protein [Neisseria weaveri]EGV35247.1 membrane lipoprotein [Neisseria weaveri ATCC 51223]EGV37115.1 membrane lipoprotein [Neisseria weaveri LMG 5135]VEJ49655.1 Membrane lipoprotein [Neisseria weaveri]
MKHTVILTVLSALALSACKDDTQAKLDAQQKQIEALQQQLAQQNANPAEQDNTVYQLAADAVKDTIPAEFQNGNNGEPVTGTDGQQYIYDESTGSWLLQSLIGAAAGAFIGSALANKFQKANPNSPAVQRAQANYYQSAKPQQRTTQQLNTKSVPAQKGAASPQYRQTNQAQPNHKRPVKRGGFGRRR